MQIWAVGSLENTSSTLPGCHGIGVPSPSALGSNSRLRVIILALTMTLAVVIAVFVDPADAHSAPTSPSASAPTPAPKVLPAQMDSAQQYEGQSICDPVIKPGIAKLRSLLRKTYGKHTFYTTRACAADPNSEHTEGRALDWMVDGRIPAQRAQAKAMLKWLLATGPDGTIAANARRMGIMYMAWNNQIWRSYSRVGWGELKGCLAKSRSSVSWDTECHRNHIHFSLTWDGAAARTSYWDGTAQTSQPCPSPSYKSGSVRKLPRTVQAVALRRKKILSTTSGRGNGGRICRLQEDRWSGDGHRLDLKVDGRGGVPRSAALQVTLRVVAVDPNAPMQIYVWPAGSSQPHVAKLTTVMNQPAQADITVAVGASGYVSIATGTGDTNVRAYVLGYTRAAPAPAKLAS